MPLPFADRPIPTAADLERSKPAVVSAIEGAALRPEEPYAPGRPWTRRTLAWHIVDTEAAMANRLCRILAEDRPALVGIPQDIWAMGLPQRRNPVIAASWFQTTRAMVVDLLQDLPVSAWERTGTHSEYGAMRFADVLRHLHEHAWHHAEQLDSTFSPEAAPTKTMSHAVTLHRLEDRPRDAADFRIIRIAALRSDPDAFGET